MTFVSFKLIIEEKLKFPRVDVRDLQETCRIDHLDYPPCALDIIIRPQRFERTAKCLWNS